MKKKSEKIKNTKKEYKAPGMMQKPMTGSFMICARNTQQCPPGTAIKNLGSCF